jgi:hypothetical protein
VYCWCINNAALRKIECAALARESTAEVGYRCDPVLSWLVNVVLGTMSRWRAWLVKNAPRPQDVSSVAVHLNREADEAVSSAMRSGNTACSAISNRQGAGAVNSGQFRRIPVISRGCKVQPSGRATEAANKGSSRFQKKTVLKFMLKPGPKSANVALVKENAALLGSAFQWLIPVGSGKLIVPRER